MPCAAVSNANAPAPAAAEPPLSAAEFAGLLDRLGPFEAAPRFAVAVSGGADSLTLCLLAARYAQARGGQIVGLTVDHGLRPESAAEAAQVARWLATRDLAHRTLRWTPPRTGRRSQAAARDARYRLLTDACRALGAVHLLIAQHAEDQAETRILRAAAGSGAAGLAGMSALRVHRGVRLLRPLLSVPKARLRATLTVAGQPWLEDPSNRDPRFARARLRRDGGGEAPFVAAGRRPQIERDAAALALDAVEIDPAGFAWLAASPLLSAGAAARLALVRALLRTIGGGPHWPPEAQVARLLERLRDAPGGSLGRCCVARRRARWLVYREVRALPANRPLSDGARWDRFVVDGNGDSPGRHELALGAGGRAAWAAISRWPSWPERRSLPAPVRASLPLVFARSRSPGRQMEPVAVPHLGIEAPDCDDLIRLSLRFCPLEPLFGPPFTVA